MMKIAIATGGTDRGRSGLSAYVHAVLPRLRRRIEQAGGATVALGGREDLDAYAAHLDGAARVVTRELWRPAPLNALWHLGAAGRAAARAGADVLLLPAANRRATLRSPIPTVAVVHDLAPLRVKRRYDALRMAYGQHLVTGALATADVLVAVSDVTRADVEQALGRPPGSVRVIPNGVDHERFAPAAADDPRVREARRRLRSERPYVLYLGRLEHPGKNLLRLVQAFAESAARGTHTLALAGADWGAEPLIRAEIARLGLDREVELLGYLPDAVVPGLVAGADAVAMVGLYEGFGLPALEALAAGRPVVASRTGALPEVVGDLGALCDPHDTRSIAEALARALGDEAHRDRVRREGPARAAARSWEKTADALLDACRDAVARRRGA
ncbi:glycosyltransferase family 4 protein [Sorangium sp. So ce131]|uniref:glycosyltransferase family 4 protein n=1 Tax=Sorangium sp. So ce131 TaxID=3133282 RepID=UPI003F6290B6